MIEEINRVAQLDEEIFLARALARDIADCPGGPARVLPRLLQRPHAEAQPAYLATLGSRHSHLFLQWPAFACRLGEPVDRFRDLRIPDEHALDGPHIIGIDRVHEL